MSSYDTKTEINSEGLIDLEQILGPSGGIVETRTASDSTSPVMYGSTSIRMVHDEDKEASPLLSVDAEVKSNSFILKSKSPVALKILRTHFVDKILAVLDWLSEHHEQNNVNSTLHINDLFEHLLMLFNKNHEDHFSSLAIAMYDGLSKDDFWLKLDKSDYGFIKSQFTNLANRDFTDYSQIDKAIAKIEAKTGIDSTPY